MREKLIYALCAIAAGLLTWNLYKVFLVEPDEANQGAIYRIIYIHVPSAMTCATGFFVAFAAGLMYLWKKDLRYDAIAYSVRDGADADVFILPVGNLKTPGEKVTPGLLSAVYTYDRPAFAEVAPAPGGRPGDVARARSPCARPGRCSARPPCSRPHPRARPPHSRGRLPPRLIRDRRRARSRARPKGCVWRPIVPDTCCIQAIRRRPVPPGRHRFRSIPGTP